MLLRFASLFFLPSTLLFSKCSWRNVFRPQVLQQLAKSISLDIVVFLFSFFFSINARRFNYIYIIYIYIYIYANWISIAVNANDSANVRAPGGLRAEFYETPQQSRNTRCSCSSFSPLCANNLFIVLIYKRDRSDRNFILLTANAPALSLLSLLRNFYGWWIALD